jgi:hypothetical protein
LRKKENHVDKVFLTQKSLLRLERKFFPETLVLFRLREVRLREVRLREVRLREVRLREVRLREVRLC